MPGVNDKPRQDADAVAGRVVDQSEINVAGPTGNNGLNGVADDDDCWVCGGPVVKRHCKIVCPRCGFMRDCSDP